MIEVRQLTKAFGARTALSGIDLSIANGERVMLVGPNGAGKSTLLRILATLSRPTAGSVRIGGEDAVRAGAAVRQWIGFLSHDTLLYDDLSAEQNLRFYARMYGLSDTSARITALLSQVNLERRAGDQVRTFSRGMKQRLAVARAVLHRPRLLLLDEPYTGLDLMASERLSALLLETAADGCTLVLTTHHPDIEGAIAQRVVLLRAGRIVEDGPVGDVRAFPAHYRELVDADPRVV